jgi:hypothetical protein
MVAASVKSGYTMLDAVMAGRGGCTQDDCSSTRILYKIFGQDRISVWNDGLISDHVRDINMSIMSKWKEGDFSNLEKCPSEDNIYPVNSMISVHAEQNDEGKVFAEMVGKFPDYVYLYRVEEGHGQSVCRGPPGYINPGMTVEGLRKDMVIIDLKSLPSPGAALQAVCRPLGYKGPESI